MNTTEQTDAETTSSLQRIMVDVKAFLDKRREVLSHAGDDCREYHATRAALDAGHATADEVLRYLLSPETQHRLNASGAGVDRWADLIVRLQKLHGRSSELAR